MYRNQVKSIKKEEMIENTKVPLIRTTLETRSKRKFFNMLAANKVHTIASRKKFGKCLITHQNKFNSHYFSIWHRSLQAKKSKKLRKKRKMVEEEL